jgi:hypothetical protein
MRSSLRGLCLGSILVCVPFVAHAQAKPATPLPLDKVRLYETGVGYFERTGSLRGGAGEMSLPVPAGHLDDALKTLVVLSQDGEAHIDGIEFASSVSRGMGMALAGLPADGDGAVSYQGLLGTLKGAQVELRTAKESVSGRLIDVEPPPPDGHRECTTKGEPGGEAKEVCTVTRHSTLLLLTDAGEIRRFRSTDVTGVKPADAGWQARLDAAVDSLSERGAQTARELRVLGQAGKPITLGYIAETPVWRSTYRLVLPDAGDHAAVQGWALLHNDTDEDWKKVKVELVNGQPDSFLFPLAAPRYTRRELRTPEQELHTVPQLLDRTVDNLWGDDIGEAFGAGGLGLSGIGEGGGGRGEGIGLGSVGTIGHGSGTGAGQSDLLTVGNLASLAGSTGVEAGALFRYALDRPIDLRAHGSALLPFVQEQVKVRRIAYFEDPGQTARSSVHLENDTRQTLPAGTISVFEQGGFAGETTISRTQPGEARILGFGTDLDVELDESQSTSSDEPRVLTFAADVLTVHFVRHHTVSYALTNRGGSARMVYFPLRYVSNADVQGADELAFDDERGQPLAVFDVPAHTNGRKVLEVREGLSRTVAWDALDLDALRDLARVTELPVEQRGLLRKAARRLFEETDLGGTIAQKQRELDELQEDLEGLRSTAHSLGEQAGEIRERLVEAETTAGELRRQIRALERKKAGKRNQARAALERLNAAAPHAS